MNSENILHVFLRNKEGLFAQPFVIRKTPEQIASVIVRTQEVPEVRFVDVFDMPYIVVQGGFVHKTMNQKFLQEELLPVLIPMQREEVEPVEIEPLTLTKEEWKN